MEYCDWFIFVTCSAEPVLFVEMSTVRVCTNVGIHNRYGITNTRYSILFSGDKIVF